MATAPELSSLGFRIVTDVPRAPREVVDGFLNCSSTDVADAVGKLFTVAGGIRPLYTPVRRIVGSAFTVRVPPGDNLMVHAAVHRAGEGDIIVVDARGDTEYALGGALLCAIAKANGVRGLVLDGVYRDSAELKQLDFPVFGRGLYAKAPAKEGPGEINTVICLGSVPVHPGDIVVADEEGCAIVPLAYAEAVLAKAKQRGRTDAGRWGDLSAWSRQHEQNFDQVLRAKGCHFS